MPELPDVQVFKEYLDATALHRRIAHVYLSADDVLESVSSSTLRSRLQGRALESSRRHGKHLFAALDNAGWLRLHFGMTGLLKYYKNEDEAPDHLRLRLDFENGYHLGYKNTRKLGQIGLVDDVHEFIADAELGPDALSKDFGLDEFSEALAGRRGSIKGTLMNQSVIAGIGNIYSDEILFHAGVHPEAVAGDLDDETVKALFRAMRSVLQRAIEARVENFPDDFLLPHREDGAECPRCGSSLRKMRVSGRSTYFCPGHQRSRGG